MNGLALGAWGAVQASAAGIGIVLGGTLRDVVVAMAHRGMLGPVFADPAAPYSVVYHLEILALFATLIALGPLVRRDFASRTADIIIIGSCGIAGNENVERIPSSSGGWAMFENWDLAQVVLYLFWIFFAGLLFYLRREDRPRRLSARSRHDARPFPEEEHSLLPGTEDIRDGAWRRASHRPDGAGRHAADRGAAPLRAGPVRRFIRLIRCRC